MNSAEDNRFLSEKVTMIETSTGGEPVRFSFRDAEHRVTQIVRQWQDFGFSPVTHRKNWRNRRHRNYYEVKTDQDAHLLLYFDRGVKPSSPRQWYVLEQYL